MASFEFNKVAGAVMIVVLTVTALNMVRNGLRPSGGQQGDGHGGPVVVAKKPAGKPAASKAKTLPPVGPLLAAASADEGRRVFSKCSACHATAKGAKQKIGPNLWNIVNASTARQAGFDYSDALRGLKAKWTYENLNRFVARPRGFAPGTRMGFAGIKKPSDRANLIKYLRSLSEFPAPLP